VKQTIFVAAITLAGAIGAFAVEPFVGVVAYYFFAVLRPQAIWEWALPMGIAWSAMIGWATIVASVWFLMTRGGDYHRPPLTAAHKAFLVFAVWLSLTCITALDKDIAMYWFTEYMKLFVMFFVAALVLHQIRHVWWIYLASTVALIYIAYELNFQYLTVGRLDIYHYGYGGLDNNGAGLMLAMAVPLAIHAWESLTSRWRWLFITAVPVLIHAVLMSYSRGAMLSMIMTAPLLILRSRRRLQFAFVFLLVLGMVPFLAGNEIRQRFLSVQGYESDGSANARFGSWAAAFRIANDYPVLGVGIRNSQLISYEYGANEEGQAIHSQYLQILADTGYPALFLYLLAVACTWAAMARARRALKKRNDPDAKRAHSMLNGLEGALFMFCFGGLFLSLEVFELPYLVALLGAQIASLTRLQAVAAQTAPVPAAFPVAHQRA
jgi:probable O-glycosylation ligase (exosortase A-associated)